MSIDLRPEPAPAASLSEASLEQLLGAAYQLAELVVLEVAQLRSTAGQENRTAGDGVLLLDLLIEATERVGPASSLPRDRAADDGSRLERQRIAG